MVLDAAGQLVGFWTADRLDHGRAVFPFRLAELELFGGPPEEGAQLGCSAAIDLVGDQLVSSDIDVVEASGRCLMRLTGWEDKRFPVPTRLEPLSLPAELPALSDDWPGPRLRLTGTLSCRRFDTRIGPDAALWTRVWASRILSRQERDVLAGERRPAAARLQWLAARTAGKDAVAELLRATLGLELLPADIEILPDRHGCPRVRLPGTDLGDREVVVSLTHSGAVAAALAALVRSGHASGIGIDLEPVRPRAAGFLEAAFSAEEIELLHALPADRRDEWQLRLWCAREAAGKAVGLGILPGPATPRILAVDPTTELVTARANGRRLAVHTGREHDLVVATTLWEEKP